MKDKSEKNSKNKIIKRIFVVLFVLLNIAVIAFTAINEFGNNENAAALKLVEIKWWLIIPAAVVFAIGLVAEIYKYYEIMRRMNVMPDYDKKMLKYLKTTNHVVMRDGEVTEKEKIMVRNRNAWRVAQRTVLLGRYYDNITPASVGGQPFQIYYMNKNGIKNDFGTVIPLIAMISDQIGFLIIAIISILLGTLTGQIWNPAIVAVGWIGLIIFAMFPLVILGATFLPNTTNEIITICVKFLHKIHIIKDEKATREKAIESVKHYASGIKSVLKAKGLFARNILLSVVYFSCLSMIPYFVLSAFGANIGFFACFATTVAVSAAVYFIPTPGNAGAAEGTFYSVFSVLPVAGYVFWAMLVWRFFVYYNWLILGGITQIKMYLEDKNFMNSWKSGVEKVNDSISKTRAEAKELGKKE